MSHEDADGAPDLEVVIGDLERALGFPFSARAQLKVRDVLCRVLPKPTLTAAKEKFRDLPHLEPIGDEPLTDAMNRLRGIRDETLKQATDADLIAFLNQFPAASALVPPTSPATGDYLETAILRAVEALELAAEAYSKRGNKYAALRLINLARQAEVERLRAALSALYELVRHETDLPEGAANGVVDSTGTLDEGVCPASAIIEAARTAMGETPRP